MISGELEQAGIEVRYERAHGVHEFVLADGTPLTAISASSWEEYYDEASSLEQPEGLVVSPELITTPHPIAEIPSMLQVAAERIETVRELSQRLSAATFVLGTIVQRPQHLTNSLVVLEDGLHTSVIDKRVLTSLETDYFATGRRHVPTPLGRPNHQLAICADLFDVVTYVMRSQVGVELPSDFPPSIVNGQTESLIVSSCWAVPMPYHDEFARSISPEMLYGGQLERLVKRIFGGHPALREVVMVDRAIPISGVQPYNAHFTRNADFIDRLD